MGNSESEIEELENWKEASKSNQETCREYLGDRIWDEYDLATNFQSTARPNPISLLWRAISVAVLGQPKECTPNLGFDEKEWKRVDDIAFKCIKHCVDKRYIKIAFLYVCVNPGYKNLKFLTPVIRIKSIESNQETDIPSCVYIDYLGRVYESWGNYKKENSWNRCWICVPAQGFYSLRSEIFYEILDQTDRGNVLYGLDIASGVTGILSTVGMVVGGVLSIIPVTTPIGIPVMIVSAAAGAPSAVYGAGRSIASLVDRGTHDQSLLDINATMFWMGAVFGVLGVIAVPIGGGISILGRTSSIVGRIGLGVMGAGSACTTLSYTTAGIVSIALSIADKKIVDDLDILKLQCVILSLKHVDVEMEALRSFVISLRSSNETGTKINNDTEPREVPMPTTSTTLTLNRLSDGRIAVQLVRTMTCIKTESQLKDMLRSMTRGRLSFALQIQAP